MTADVLIAAQGPLSDPSLPEVPGIESFEGKAFHSAQWDHDHDLTGERVAVIGTGASAIQFVPEIQPQVGKLHVFQRTAPWVIPHRNRPMKRWERALYRLFPPAQLAMRAGIYWARESFVLQFRHRAIGKLLERIPLRHMRKQVKDPELREEAHAGLQHRLQAHPADERVVSGAREAERRGRHGRRSPRSGRTRWWPTTAREREVDTIIFGTGFHVTDMPIADRVSGRDGRTLAEAWNGQHAGLQGHDRRRLPEPVLPGRAEHRPRAHVDRVHDRVADRLRARRAPHDAPPRRAAPSRCDTRRRRPTTRSSTG